MRGPMIGRAGGLLLACVLLATALGGVLGVAAQDSGITAQAPGIARHTGHPKLESALDQLVAAREDGEMDCCSRRLGMELKGERIRVVVEAQPGMSDGVGSLLRDCRATVEARYKNLSQAMVPVDNITALAETPQVRFVRLPYRTRPLAVSEGVALIDADSWHAAGLTGVGVKVGILDVGFAGYEALLGTELPATVHTHWAPSIGGPGSSSHGTRCAEIAHDVAPGAELYLANVDVDVEWGEAVDWLIAQGVDVVSASVGLYLTGPGDGTGILCDIVATAADAGVLWCQAAGNQAQTHWAGSWQDTGGEADYHEFHLGPLDESNAISVDAGDTVYVGLRWDDTWGESDNDYDMELYDDGGNCVAWSCDDQNGEGCYPSERIIYVVPAGGTYHLKIYQWDSSRDVVFHLMTWQHEVQYQVAAGSLVDPADSPDAMTMGAVLWDAPGSVAVYSSQGPTADGRVKPDMVGPTGVSTSAGSSGGTSAATPHGAGAAALVKGRYPVYTPAQVRDYLEGEAVDLGDPGKDNLHGEGRLRMPAGDSVPAVRTDEASAIGETSATLNGTLTDDAGEACTCRFIYGSEPGVYQWQTSWAGNVTIGECFSEAVSGLEQGSTYYFRAQAENSLGVSSGDELTFVAGGACATLDGRISLQGRPSPPSDTWVSGLTVRFFQAEVEVRMDTVVTDGEGVFVIADVVPGDYDIAVKSSRGLSRLQTGVVMVAGTTTSVDFGIVLEGDANDDDRVTLADYSLLYAAYGSVAGDPNWRDDCDFNRNGMVDLGDYSLLYANYGLAGELYA